MRTALKQFRIGEHLTQSEFATSLNVSRATYSFIERGERIGSMKFWQKLQQHYKVPDEQMFKLMKLDEVKPCETKGK